MEPTLSRRDHIRAGLIVLHMVALLVMCLPVPGTMGKARQQDPAFQAQLRSWRAVGEAVGISIGQDEALQLVLQTADVMRSVRHKSVKVVKPYIRRVGAGQAWQMFGVVHTTPGLLRVEVQEDGQWRDLFVHGDPTADWMGRFFYSERGRALLDQYSNRSRLSSYERLSAWLACRAKADFPEATELRTSIQVRNLIAPQKLRKRGELPVQSTRWERTFDLGTCTGAAP